MKAKFLYHWKWVASFIFGLILGALLLPSSSHAGEVEEWRLLGPGASWHETKAGAQIVQVGTAPTTQQVSCPGQNNVPVVPVRQPGQPSIPMMSMWCFVVVTTPGAPAVQEWSQFNPALGLERIRRDETGFAVRDFAQLVRDSYSEWGLMAGRGFTKRLAESENFALDAGVAAGLWYRTTAEMRQELRGDYLYCVTDLKRRLVPFILPLASITHKPSGVGLTASILPRLIVNDIAYIPTTTVVIQATFSLNLI